MAPDSVAERIGISKRELKALCRAASIHLSTSDVNLKKRIESWAFSSPPPSAPASRLAESQKENWKIWMMGAYWSQRVLTPNLKKRIESWSWWCSGLGTRLESQKENWKWRRATSRTPTMIMRISKRELKDEAQEQYRIMLSKPLNLKKRIESLAFSLIPFSTFFITNLKKRIERWTGALAHLAGFLQRNLKKRIESPRPRLRRDNRRRERQGISKRELKV